MTSKRRAAAAASPDMKFRRTKRRKVSDDDIIPEESNRASSHLDSEPPEEADQTPESQAESEAEFEGDSLQTAQDKIMSELTRLKDADGEDVSYPFIGKPDRNLYRDYYEIIQHPVSLRSIQKRVRGTDSRKNSSRTTAYPTWQSFEEEVSYVWRNAREYNEDDSDIAVLAGVLEDHFHRRVAEAKKLVPDPLQVDGTPEMPRIKLKLGTPVPPMAQRLTLKMPGQSSDTLSKDDGKPSDVAFKNESQGRKQDIAGAGLAGQEISRSPRGWSRGRQLDSPRSSTTATPSGSEQQQTGSMSAQGLPVTNATALAMSTSQNHPNASFDISSDVTRHSSSASAYQPQFSSSPMDSLLRRSDQDPKMALIRNVQIITHPSLSLQPDFCLDIPPSSLVSQQNITIHLPPSHNILTVRPRLAPSTSQRQVKIVALMGVQRLHSSGDASTLSYDIHLHPGMTKVDLEAIAGPARGVPKSGPPGSDVDYERVTLFFNLLR
ncbi:Bromodomain [Penicillium cf. griseofulvum]|uniref:Bromodomain n=1 Tax=Penicillium cf. griseofulvum TaxID=2972120 RepID=A0A9W9T163_9EURO|nr:Bromodomain [Penicillium cf. griseofulvum]KAJ5441341.1 Bromodomain [Penicillium cf. griseofulvum]KAJ5449394.1 Bromodomain [Penicillium cf. griseofulvum]